MSLRGTVPGSEVTIDWRAVFVGAVVLGALCSIPALGMVSVSTADDATAGDEKPELLPDLIPYLVGVPGAFVAGYLARSPDLEGAIEGGFSVPVGTPIPIAVAMVDQFLLLGNLSVGWALEFVWRGVGAYAVIGILFVPLAALVGAAAGWLGHLAHDVVHGSVRFAWS